MTKADAAVRPSEMKLGPVLISAADIRARAAALAEQIENDHRAGPVRFLVALKGAWMFAADLARVIRSDVEIEFLRASSYADGTGSCGRVELTGLDELDLVGSRVVVVEDIVDTGLTAHSVLEHLGRSSAKSVRVAALLSKPSRRIVDVKIDYLGFEIADNFVVGYGMDCGEAYRNLPDIHVLQRPSGSDQAHGAEPWSKDPGIR